MSDPEVGATRDRSAPIIITRAWLEKHGALCGDLDVFTHVFGESAELTRANLNRAVAAGIDLDWFANAILTAQVRLAYLDATVTAWQAYLNTTATVVARQAYEDARAVARQVYLTVAATALADLLELPPEQEPHP